MLLGIASGASDSMAYLQLGHVFASAMTGAAALFGIALTQFHWFELGRVATALAGFSLGGLAAAALLRRDVADPAERHEMRLMFILEAVALAAFVTLWMLVPKPLQPPLDEPLIALLSFAMGVQNVAALQMDVPGINTVVINNTLARIAIGVTRRIEQVDLPPRRERAFRRQLTVIGAYGGGAVIGAAIALAVPVATGWPPLIAVVIVAVMLPRFNPSRPRRVR